MKFPLFLLFALVSTACTGPADDDPVDSGDTDDTDDTDPPEDTSPPLPVVDCTTLPVGPFQSRILTAPRGYHGLAFDQVGGLVGSDNTSLLRATSPTEAAILSPNFGSAQQMAYLPDGDLIVVGGEVRRVTPEGAVTVLASGVGAYGVTIGPDGFIYTANENRVDRIDPDSGASAVFVPSNQVSTPKVLNFSRDGTQLYIGTNSSNGNIYKAEIDENGNAGTATRIGNTGGSWHDGMGVDACGNLYINEYWTSTLYRLRTDGTMESLINFDSQGPGYGHGNEWGSGIGEWDDHKLYVPLPYDGDRIGEIDLGIPSKNFNGGQFHILEAPPE